MSNSSCLSAQKKNRRYCTIVSVRVARAVYRLSSSQSVVALNQAANGGWAPMRIAACSGDSDTMEVLSSPHTDLSQAINKGNTPLKISARFGKKETAATVLRSLAHVPLVRQRGLKGRLVRRCHANGPDVPNKQAQGTTSLSAHGHRPPSCSLAVAPLSLGVITGRPKARNCACVFFFRYKLEH